MSEAKSKTQSYYKIIYLFVSFLLLSQFLLPGLSFSIEATPPTVTLNPLSPDPMSDNTPTFTGTATDTESNIKSVEYTLDDGAHWNPAQASNGAFDEKIENYTFTTSFLSDKVYTVKVRATDTADNTTEPSNYVADEFTIDTTAPAAFDLSFPANGFLTNNTLPTLSWNASSDATSGLSKYQLYVDGSLNKDNILPVSTSTNPTFSLSSGSHTWYVKAIDKAGNTRQSTSSRGIIIDIISPDAPMTLAPAPATWTNNNSFAVSWSNPFDPSRIAGAYYKLDSAPISNTDGTLVEGIDISSISGIQVTGSSEHKIYVWLKDGAGNADYENRAQTTLKYDANAPADPSVSSPSHALSTWSTENIIDINWSKATDNLSGADGFSFEWSTSSGTLPDDVKDCEEDQASTASPALTDSNSWYFHIKAVDNAGNWSSTATHYGPFYVDTANPPAPNVSSATHPNENNWYSNDDPRLNWTEPSDVSGISGYSYVWDHSSDTEPDTEVDITDRTKSFTNQTDGIWYFHIRAKDNVGHWGETKHFTVRIDTTSPETFIDTYASGTIQTGTISFSWHGEDSQTASSDLLYSYKLEGFDLDWSDWTSSTFKLYSELPNGSYTFMVRAKDKAEIVDFSPDGQPFTVKLEPAHTWYLAEGYTAGEFDAYILVMNPSKTENALINLYYLTPEGQVPGPFEILGPGERRTFKVDDTLPSSEVSTIVTSQGAKVIAERAVYFNYFGIKGGHDSVGVTESSNTWYLAEGYTEGEFDTFILVMNPSSAESAQVKLTYLTPDGEVVGPTETIGPGQRKTFKVDNTLPNSEVSTIVASTGAKVIAERAVYFNYFGIKEGHDSVGVTQAANTWYLAEGYTADVLNPESDEYMLYFDTYILVMNPSKTDTASVQLTYLTPEGEVAGPSDTIGPGKRRTFIVDDTIPASEVSTKVTSTGAKVIAERAVYFNYFGIKGGHDSIGYWE